MYKAIAIVCGLLAFLVNFFDQMYRLNDAEWVPEVLSAILIGASVTIWQNGNRKREEAAQSADDLTADPKTEQTAAEQQSSSED